MEIGEIARKSRFFYFVIIGGGSREEFSRIS